MTGLIRHWPLNEESGVDECRDLSGNGANGNLVGPEPGGPGLRGTSGYLWDNPIDYIIVPNTNVFDGSDDFTISLWINSQSGGVQYLFAPLNEYNWRLIYNDQGNRKIRFGNFNGTTNDISYSNNSIPEGKWAHVLVTFSSSGRRQIYINGRLDVDDSIQTNPETDNHDNHIGADESVTDDFEGYMSDFRIYDRVLSEPEVRELYKRGAPHNPRFKKGSVDVTSGLVSRYTMDQSEVSGSTLTDTIGSNNGTINGATTGIAGVDGGESFDFDGTDDNVDMGDQSSHEGFSEFTILGWFNPYTNNDGGFGKWDRESANGQYLLRVDQGTDAWQIDIEDTGGTVYTANGGQINLNKWQLVVGVWDGNALYLYQDSRLVDSTSANVTLQSSSASFKIGEYDNSDKFYTGLIDEVRIYDRALTQSEINTIYHNFNPESKTGSFTDPNFLTSGLVSRYSMDDSDVSGSTLTDSAGSNDGTISGATTGVAGIGQGEAFDFDGTDDEVVVSHDNSLDVSFITLSFWMKNNDSGNFSATITKKDSYRAFIDTSAEISMRIFSSSTGYTVGPISAPNSWNHYTMTYDGDELKGYKNGVLFETNSSPSGSIDSNATDLVFGNTESGGTEEWNGTLDEVRIYNRALNATEVWTLYQQGKRLIPELVEAR